MSFGELVMLTADKKKNMTLLIILILSVCSQPAMAWCVLNDSVLPLAIFREPDSTSAKVKIENLKAEIKCLEQKKNETMQDDFYRYNFYGLDND